MKQYNLLINFSIMREPSGASDNKTEAATLGHFLQDVHHCHRNGDYIKRPLALVSIFADTSPFRGFATVHYYSNPFPPPFRSLISMGIITYCLELSVFQSHPETASGYTSRHVGNNGNTYLAYTKHIDATIYRQDR